VPSKTRSENKDAVRARKYRLKKTRLREAAYEAEATRRNRDRRRELYGLADPLR